jgi:hypothetical protein
VAFHKHHDRAGTYAVGAVAGGDEQIAALLADDSRFYSLSRESVSKRSNR